MGDTSHILGAFWETTERGLAYLARDWADDTRHPPLSMGDGVPFKLLRRMEPLFYAYRSGYCFDGDDVVFAFFPPFYQNIDWENETLYVAGDFNGWGDAVGQARWQLRRQTRDGLDVLIARAPKADVLKTPRPQFKFVADGGHWVEIPRRAPNVADDERNRNFEIQQERTGRNLFLFWPPTPHRMGDAARIAWNGARGAETHEIQEGFLLYNLSDDKPLGATVRDGRTVFRVFAPRATAVAVRFRPHRREHNARSLSLTRADNGVWEGTVAENLDGWFYYYAVDGVNRDGTTAFDARARVMDPWAKAVIGPESLGIVVADARFCDPHRVRFEPARWHDLAIAECHVRDLLARAPYPLTDDERKGFAGLTKCLAHPDFYLRRLGVNAVELQPVQENDAPNRDAYHWGYMTTNFFSPASQYAADPEHASQIGEFRDLVRAFHKAGIAVIIDVVYNHAGEPNHLLRLDKTYYFNSEFGGGLTNWSGCGNDLRTYTPMARRLIVESLLHWIRAYDVDGFRFDLADLVGIATLKEVEKAVKAEKPSAVLIAEPWSFRGHIAQALRHTRFASWNDGFREFVYRYVTGAGNCEGLEYYLKGSPENLALWPAQTVNYTASHDDRCWIDKITENARHDGLWPTALDQRRTRLMLSILFAALGIPMLAQGQDFMHSKRGVANTYQDGEKNALDYARADDYSDTAAYARAWIRFRLGKGRRLLCRDGAPDAAYFKFFRSGRGSALAALFNAGGRGRLLYAVNPHPWDDVLQIDGVDASAFYQIADHNRFDENGALNPQTPWRDGALRLPAFSCALFAAELA